MPSNKPEYASAYQKKWYKKNKAKHIAACNKRRDKQVKENQNKVIAYLKEHPCVDCGETDIVVLQFDHIRGKKHKEISRMMMYPWSKLRDEIVKCDIRCANDHARRTSMQRNDYKWVASVAVA